MDRIASGGTLRLSLPLGLARFDPHDFSSFDAAVFESALFDSLYALDESGRPYPTLAETLPEPAGNGLRVTLRAGLRTAADKPLDAADVVFSLKRAQAGAAASWLAPFGTPRTVRGEARAVVFPSGDATSLATILASGATALVPRGFAPGRPDGTGAFRAVIAGDGVTFERNPRAARGPAFLDSIVARRAQGLADALRAFEAGLADVGWLSTGLHHARKSAVRFDAGAIGFVVLVLGQRLGAWGAPGVAQTVLDGVDRSSLSALGVRAGKSPNVGRSGGPWRGPASDVLVDGDCPQLVAIAHSLVELLGGSAQGLRVVPTPASELARAREAGDFSLLVDFVRKVGSAPGDDARALTARAGMSAPSVQREPLESVVRRLKLGIIGALHIEGAFTEKHSGIAKWHLDDAHEIAEPRRA